MRWLAAILGNRFFLIGLGFFLSVALVLLLGAWLEWAWTIRLLGLIVVLLVFIGILVISYVRANHSADRIERSIRQQAEQQLISTRPDRRGEVEEMQRKLDEAIEKLKQSKLGQGKRGRAALYALPWYLFIGPPGSGKTTAIANSGLNFPLGTDRIRGVGGTRNCDWFFSDQAILLDTAGRYMTEQDDDAEWLTFLDTLRAQRPARPINGVIVGIALDDLLNASPDEIDWHADNIRRRVDELISRLGVRFPVYLVVTKIDLLQGFVEFFGELSRREREQIWGATLSQDAQQKGDVRPAFEEEYDRMHAALIDRRTARLSRPMKRAERQKVYAFPLQFGRAKASLAQFVGRLFQPNPYQESPVFRGFYFTSGTQEGVPLDRVIQAIAQQFELRTNDGDDFMVHQEAKSYFIKDFFTDVVVPDQFMVRRTTKARRVGNWQRVGITVGSVVLLLLFILGVSQAFVRSRARLGDARSTATEAALIRWDSARETPDNFARLERLEDEIKTLDDTPLLSLGLHRDGTVLEPSRRLYLSKTRSMVQATALRPIEQRMQASLGAARADAAVREQVYMDLKSYLLLTQESSRLEDDDLRAYLSRYLVETTAGTLQPQVEPEAQAEMTARIEPKVNAFVEALRTGAVQPFQGDADLVVRARQGVIEPPSIQSIYNRLRREAFDKIPPLTLEEAVPGRYLDLFSGRPEVPGFFTQRGWSTFVDEAIERESADPGRDDWVVGIQQGEIPAELRNSELVAAGLESLYFEDYINEWQRFLRSVQLGGFGDIRAAARAMNDLSNAYESPIVYLLARATAETTFENALLGQVAEQAEAGVGRAIQRGARRVLGQSGSVDVESQRQRHPVDQRFQWLHNLQANQAESGNASPELYQAFESLREVSSVLEGMTSDAAKAAETAAQVLAENGGVLAAEQRAVRGALRSFDSETRNNLFDVPIIRAWDSMLGVAQGYLNDRWRTVVHEPFQSRFASQYPFDAGSAIEAPIFDVEEFFNPESGAVASFIEGELAPYLGRDLSRPRTWEDRGLRLSSATQQAIARARAIGENLYSSGAMRLSFELQAEVPERTGNAPAVDQVAIEIHGRQDTYGLGGYRPWVPFEWPGPGGAMISVSTQTGDLAPKRYEGDWALFRMLQDARITRQSAASFELRWPFEQPNQWTITALYNLRTRSAANPFGDPRSFFSFRPPPSLN